MLHVSTFGRHLTVSDVAPAALSILLSQLVLHPVSFTVYLRLENYICNMHRDRNSVYLMEHIAEGQAVRRNANP
jgi:hypothetical protein